MLKFLTAAIIREAAYVGAAITITVDAIVLMAQTAAAGITAAWVAVYVRSVSTPRVAADERVEEAVVAARNAALADVSSLTPVGRPARARKATQKAAAKPR